MKQQVNTLKLETDRTILEPLTPEHSEVLFEPFCDPDLYHYIFWEIPKSVESLRTFFDRICKGSSDDGKQLWLNWASRDKESGQYSGFFETTIDGSDASLAYFTFKPFQQKGYAKEGVLALIEGLTSTYSPETFTVEMDTRNRASVKLAESMGFRWHETVNNACELKDYQSHEFVFRMNAKK